MPKGRTPSPRGRATPGWIRPLLPVLAFAGLFTASCQHDNLLKPGSVETNILTAVYFPNSAFAKNPIEINGEAKQIEWGGPLDPGREYTYIRMTAEDGSGSPGQEIYVAAKAIYTDTDIYFLFQWADPTEDVMKDAMHYIGPDVPDSACYIGNDLDTSLLTHASCGAAGGQWKVVTCYPPLMEESSWTRSHLGRVWDEDRLYLAFQIQPTGDGERTFSDAGCQVACHQGENPQFGRPGYGVLDVWEWLSTRTNVSRRTYSDAEDPNAFPLHGIMAYMDDYSAEPTKGLAPDPGQPTWFENFVDGGNVPSYIYRCRDDKMCNPTNPNTRNEFGEKVRQNNGLPLYYIWREKLEDLPLVQPFNACDIINEAVLPAGQEPRKWRAPRGDAEKDDAVGGYYYSYARGSRADIRAKAVWSDGFWTLEVARPLDTHDPSHDAIFAFQGSGSDRSAPADLVFTVAVANNSETDHWGSVPQILRFGPMTSSLAGTAEGGGR